MPRETASERVLRRLHELARRQPRGFLKSLAERLGSSQSRVTPYFSGERVPPMEVLEAICEMTGIRLAELVKEDDEPLYELTPEEALIIRVVRQWPATVRHALVDVLRYVADESPAERQTRNAHQYWRELDQTDRDWLYGILVMLRERKLPPDLRAGLVDQLSREQFAREADDVTRRRKT